MINIKELLEQEINDLKLKKLDDNKPLENIAVQALARQYAISSLENILSIIEKTKQSG